MRTYTVQVPSDGDAARAVLVAEGFAWWAVLFGPLWFLWHGLWFSALGLAVLQTAASLSAEAWLGPAAGAIPPLGIALLVGFTARDWRRWQLERRGYRLAGVVLAASADAAELRWFAQHAEPAGARAGVPA